MKKNILILNGVNLNLLGLREVNIYGHLSFEDYFAQLKNDFPTLNLSYYQSNDLNDLVNTLMAHSNYDGIVFNPGAYTHTSIVLADTIKSIQVPVIEIHISNLFGREQYRKHSFISACCSGFISGFGLKGYKLALQNFLD